MTAESITQTENADIRQRIADYFDEHFDEILTDLGEIMSIDSSYSQPAEGKPFGEGSAAALAWALPRC